MGIFDKFMSSRRDDRQRKTDAKTKEAASTVLNDLVLELSKPNLKNNIKNEDLMNYRMEIGALEAHLRKMGTLRLKVDRIDKELQYAASVMTEAIRADHPQTASQCREALVWGVLVGREDIPAHELEAMNGIIENRMEVFNAYRICMDSAKELDESIKNLNITKKKKKQKQEEIEKLDAQLNADPDLQDEITMKMGMAGGKYKGENEQEIQFINLLNERNAAQNGLKGLEDMEVSFNTKIVNLNLAISETQLNMMQLTLKKNEDLKPRIDQMTKDVTRHLAEQDQFIQDLITSVNQLSQIMLSHVEPPAVRQQRIESFRSFCEAQKLKLEEAERARIRNEQKQKNAQKQSNSQKQVLAN